MVTAVNAYLEPWDNLTRAGDRDPNGVLTAWYSFARQAVQNNDLIGAIALEGIVLRDDCFDLDHQFLNGCTLVDLIAGKSYSLPEWNRAGWTKISFFVKGARSNSKHFNCFIRSTVTFSELILIFYL